MKVGLRHMGLAVATALLLAMPLVAPSAQEVSDDRHAEYYYPTPQTSETYTARVVTLADSDRVRRLGFVTGLTQQLLTMPYPPDYAVYAKGAESEKMIIVALEDDRYNTLYRMRALLAMLTAQSRLSKFFQENTLAEHATFFDLLKMLGFEQLTISDGDEFAHQITIE
ncbi:MAG: molybdopterin-guanine dinucleotide biosynthesis protein A [Dongiaceae bacterium]